MKYASLTSMRSPESYPLEKGWPLGKVLAMSNKNVQWTHCVAEFNFLTLVRLKSQL